ncbi:MAG TPA: AAA family ATPase [Acidimicrobiales bacterium]|nr:AAA family ATPase [Acidimicrobiales bacterium]
MPEVRCPVLVGRDAEVSVLEGAVARAASGEGGEGGEGGVVFVLGEAGVGKSRLTSAAAAAARDAGMTVLRGRAAPSPAPVPYRPLAEAILSALRTSGPPATPELAPFGPALGVLVPAWAGAGGEAPAEPSVILLGEAMLALLRSVAGTSGALVLLEDLHWADAGTLELLDYLADKLDGTAVVVVVTSRAGEGAAAERLARQLRGRGDGEVVELGRLPAHGVATMVAATLQAAEVPAEVVGAIEKASDGLPFLVEEVLASLLTTGSLVSEGGTWAVRGRLEPAVPPSFAALVEDRMAQLSSPSAGRVLQTAAVLGERFDWPLLQATCDCPAEEVLSALRQAAALQLVEEDKVARGFRFRHALTRTAVMETLLLPEKVAIAERALAVLDADVISRPERLELAAELADAAGNRNRAAELLVASAVAALRTGAVTAAIEAAERVVARGGDQAHVIRGHELLLDASVLAGDVRRVVEIGEQLLARLEAGGAPAERRAGAHLRLARAAVTATDWRRAAEHLARVEALVPGAADEMQARVHLLRAHVALGEHRVAEAAERAKSARDIAARLGDDDLLCESLELLGRADRVCDLAVAERHFTEAMLTAEAAGLELRRVRALHELGTIDMVRLGPPDRLRAARDGAAAIGAPGLAAQAGMHLAVAHFVRSELDEARAVIVRAIEEAERYRLGLLVPAATTVLGAIDAVEGNRAEAIAAFERVLPLMDAEIEATGRGHVLALAALATEDRAAARAEFAAAERLCPPRSGVARAPHRGVYALLLALDPDASTTILDDLTREKASVHVATLALADLARAVLAGRAGDTEEADRAFSSAIDALADSPWYQNMGRRLVAEAAIADGWGTPAVWLREALEFFTAAGLDEPARACRSLLRRAGAPVPRRPGEGDVAGQLARLGITAREADVLSLVAEGLSNKEIGGRLYLSARTVEKHVERLMLKTGCANRAQLAALASRAGAVGT